MNRRNLFLSLFALPFAARLPLPEWKRIPNTVRYADAQRLYNYWKSKALEASKLSPKSPYFTYNADLDSWESYSDSSN